MPVSKPNITRVTIPTTNFGSVRGRPTRITFHHIVGDLAAARARFKKLGEQASATFGIGSDGRIEQFVELDRIPYSDGVFASNKITASIEHAGGHPSVPYTEKMYASSVHLVAWLIQTYGINDFKRHRDLKATACPGGLDVERIIREARRMIENSNKPPTPPTPPSPAIVYESFPGGKRRFVTNKEAILWDFGKATKWSEFIQVKRFNTGDIFEAVGMAKHPLGGVYYMTAFSFNNSGASSIPYKTVGVNKADLVEIIDPAPTPPAPVPPPVVVPTPPIEPGPPPVGPGDPKDDEQDARLNALEKLIRGFIAKLKEWFPFLK